MVERIPKSLLNGEFLHCRPVEGGAVIEASIIPSDGGETPLFKVGIVCPARRPESKCVVRKFIEGGDGFCHYYKGDSLGDYQIIGPRMDKKIGNGYQ